MSMDMVILRDILEDRRKYNDVLWISKPFHPKQSHNSNHSTNPLLFRYRILLDEEIHALMQRMYPNESHSLHFRRIDDIVNEVGYLKNITVVRGLGLLLIKILKRTVQSIFVTESKLLQRKHNMGKNPVIFLPTHRSYADFILMAFLCFNYDIEIPVVVAGMDFYSMFGMAMLLRRCGAMYMRRSFKDDKIYGTIFKKYVQLVIANGNSPFEFFIEGTRSRCGKSLPPKLGLLKMVVDVYLMKEVEDITLIPITINYERLIEDLLFVREMLGIPKPKESTTGMLKGISMLEEEYGNIYLNIGEEVSLKSFFEQNQQDKFLPHLAHLIVTKQQENAMITFFNILSAVILHCLLGNGESTLSITYLAQEFFKLKRLLSFSGALITIQGDFYEELERNMKIHKFLVKNALKGTLEIHNFEIELGFLSQDASRMVIPFMLLQHYSNCCYFFLINPAIIIAILRVERQSNRNSLFAKFSLFRSLFKHDFAFFVPFEQQDFQNACEQLVRLKFIKWIENDEIIFSEDSDVINLWCNLLIPYLKGYSLICKNLISMANRSFEEIRLKTMIKNQLLLELNITRDSGLFYGLSSHFMTCTFSSLIDERVIHVNETTKCVTVTNVRKLNVIIDFLDLLLQGFRKPPTIGIERSAMVAKL